VPFLNILEQLMDKIEVEKYILKILAETTMRKSDSISHNMHLEADLSLDSISMASLIAKFEPLIDNRSEIGSLLPALLASETVGELITLVYQNSKQESTI
jgi:acyl carrier protein